MTTSSTWTVPPGQQPSGYYFPRTGRPQPAPLCVGPGPGSDGGWLGCAGLELPLLRRRDEPSAAVLPQRCYGRPGNRDQPRPGQKLPEPVPEWFQYGRQPDAPVSWPAG